MNADEAIAYIESHTWSKMRTGLGRTLELLDRLDNPQNDLKFIHVAGTNGKGSTCAFLESILRYAGYKTGMYTSPYIEKFTEQIKVNSISITEEELCFLVKEISIIADSMVDTPSRFEILTSIAMKHFKDKGCDIVILETGMGGELDSTNVIPPAEVSVITNIGMDHTEFLGDTIEKIAETKAGILKNKTRAVIYDSDYRAVKIFKNRCKKLDIPVTVTDFSKIILLSLDKNGTTFMTEDYGEIYIPLIGRHQMKNAAVALDAIRLLRKCGYNVDKTAVLKGFKNVSWYARFEILMENPLFILDGGHNLQCVNALSDTLDKAFPDTKFTIIMGVLQDKEVEMMVESIKRWADKIICTTPDSPRALAADKLAAIVKSCVSVPVSVCDNVLTAVDLAFREERPTLAFGSLYMAGDIKIHFVRCAKKVQREICYKRLGDMTDRERQAANERIFRKLIELESIKNAKIIFSYLAMENEADLSKFHDWAKAQGKVLAYPNVEGNDMEFLDPENSRLISGKYNIRTPDKTTSRLYSPHEAEVFLIPCVGFDDNLRRLGHGAGYYDRYLLQSNNACRILIAFSCQRLEEVAAWENDLPMDVLCLG